MIPYVGPQPKHGPGTVIYSSIGIFQGDEVVKSRWSGRLQVRPTGALRAGRRVATGYVECRAVVEKSTKDCLVSCGD